MLFVERQEFAVKTRHRHGVRSGDCRLKVLLAENNVVNQKVAVQLLEKREHSVAIAAKGKRSLDALKRHDFDVVPQQHMISGMHRAQVPGEVAVS